jgi:hypothetical protein
MSRTVTVMCVSSNVLELHSGDPHFQYWSRLCACVPVAMSHKKQDNRRNEPSPWGPHTQRQVLGIRKHSSSHQTAHYNT